MYVRVITGKQKPEMEQAALDWLKNRWAPYLQKAPGFASYYALVEPHTNQVVILTFWESAEQMNSFYNQEESKRLAAQAPASWEEENTLANFEVKLAVQAASNGESGQPAEEIDCPED